LGVGSTPRERVVFQVIAAMGGFERKLIRERVRAGLRNGRANGKRLGRPRAFVDAARVAFLRVKGFGWKRIAADLGIGVGSVLRYSTDGSKIQGERF